MTVPLVTPASVPRWDLSAIFPALESREFERAFAAVAEEAAALARLFDEHGVDGVGGATRADAIDTVLDRLNAVLADAWTVEAYLLALVEVDSRDAAAQARLSEFRVQRALLSKLETRFEAWIGALDPALLDGSAAARSHAFALERARIRARHLMPRPEEELTADLNLTGATAWQKLHADLTSQLVVSLELDGETRELPMSEIRTLALAVERDVRLRAYDAELDTWRRNAVPLAAALNSIKGQVLTLSACRRWASPLDEALHTNAIDLPTLDAMLAAVRETYPDLRRYLRAKAGALRLPSLGWYDLFAPLPSGADGGSRSWEFSEATAFVVDRFATYSDRLAEYADRAFRERWIDAEPRVGKSDGAFCLLMKGDESRILTNYVPAYYGVSTLAHELGHGYHNLVRAHLAPLQRRTPMTLAETASIFCETIVRHGALAQAGPAEQLEILEGSLQDTTAVILDTISRFLFESSVFERRRTRELSVDELCELQLEAQRDTYGDALDAFHPFLWAVKPHFYSERSFYNFPYTFGLLFGLGLYARYERDHDDFRSRYDDLLAATGQADAATLARRFDIDVRSVDFWRSSLDVVRADVAQFEALLATRDGSGAESRASARPR